MKILIIIVLVGFLTSTFTISAQNAETRKNVKIDSTESLVGNKIVKKITKITKIDSIYNDSSGRWICKNPDIVMIKEIVVDSILGNRDSIAKYVQYEDWVAMKNGAIVLVHSTEIQNKSMVLIPRKNITTILWKLENNELKPYKSNDKEIRWWLIKLIIIVSVVYWLIILYRIVTNLYYSFKFDYLRKMLLKNILSWISGLAVIIILSRIFYPEVLLFELILLVLGAIGLFLINRKLYFSLRYVTRMYDYCTYVNHSSCCRIAALYSRKHIVGLLDGKHSLINKKTNKTIIFDIGTIVSTAFYSRFYVLRRPAKGDRTLFGIFNDNTGEIIVSTKYLSYNILSRYSIVMQKTDKAYGWVRIHVETGEELYACNSAGKKFIED